MKKRINWLIFLPLSLLWVTACSKKEAAVEWDYPQIKQRDTLNVLTLSGSMSYFIYRGEPRGYEYELLSDFSENQNLTLNIQTVSNENKLTERLLDGAGDLIAYNIPITNDGKETLLYTGREVINHQVLVQRANKGDTLVRDVTELIGKAIWVVKDSKYERRLKNLNDELGGGIQIHGINADSISTEDLIEMVSKGQIPYTVSDADLAKLNKTYFNNINIKLAVSHPQRASWAVRPTEPLLAAALNDWFAANANTPRHRAIVKRYFERSKQAAEYKPVPDIPKGHISPYDSAFQHYAKDIQWDWRLLVAIAYQESRFHTESESWVGATGLMGLMPRTAEAMGISAAETQKVEPSILAATRFIKRLNKSFSSIENEEQRIKFILAAYNAGPSHINDAIALAKKYNKDPKIWDGNVEEALSWKNIPEFYNDSVVKSGYFRPTETLNYVREVVERWHAYEKLPSKN
ncbi:MAG: transglycosylase SLT domain-containing protein [Candidatus Symbiothrix sp.]|jgi:membrane-bound lytic murein transglycosylase F|nr:transglycosylase SLT domain-containing protein [Candidatus Symbiothrix sp.]